MMAVGVKLALLEMTSSINGVSELDCRELPSPKATEQTASVKTAASILLSFNRRLNIRERRVRHQGLVFLSAMGVACLYLAINLVHLNCP